MLNERHVLDPRSAIAGMLIGAILGAAVAFVIGEQRGLAEAEAAQNQPSTAGSNAHAANPNVNAALVDGGVAKPKQGGFSQAMLQQARPSFAQQGEDLVMLQMLSELGVPKPTYIDIGAHHPILNNNTYLMYMFGSRGVLVEPNPVYAEKLRQVRKEDTILEVGVGVTDATEADYYILEGDGQLNTFSKEQATILGEVNGTKIKSVTKRPLVRLNTILEQHFKHGAPDVLSIDIEGMDYEVLKTLDWSKWRPKVICVETSNPRNGDVETEILDLLTKNGYGVRGGSFVNTVFLEERDRRAALAKDGGAPSSAEAGAPKPSSDGGAKKAPAPTTSGGGLDRGIQP